MENELQAARAQAREARDTVVQLHSDVSAMETRVARMEAVMTAARDLRDEWHGNPWAHEHVHAAGRQVIRAVDQYDAVRTEAAAMLHALRTAQ